MAITVLPKNAKLFVNTIVNEISLNDDGFTPDMYDIGTKLLIMATAEGHANTQKEYVIKDELTDGKNTLDLILPKNKVKKILPIRYNLILLLATITFSCSTL